MVFLIHTELRCTVNHTSNIWEILEMCTIHTDWLRVFYTVYGCDFYVRRKEFWNSFCIYTYSMVQSPSWEVNWFAASQEIPYISRNPKVHYRTHNRPPPVSILAQHNPVHIPTLFNIQSIVLCLVLPTLRSGAVSCSRWYLVFMKKLKRMVSVMWGKNAIGCGSNVETSLFWITIIYN